MMDIVKYSSDLQFDFPCMSQVSDLNIGNTKGL